MPANKAPHFIGVDIILDACCMRNNPKPLSVPISCPASLPGPTHYTKDLVKG